MLILVMSVVSIVLSSASSCEPGPVRCNSEYIIDNTISIVLAFQPRHHHYLLDLIEIG